MAKLFSKHLNIEDYTFDRERSYERAWSIFESFASGNFNAVADYEYRNLRSFYNSSVDFVRAKKKYKTALENEFGISLGS